MNGNGTLVQWLTFGALVVACLLLGVGGVEGVESPGGDRGLDAARDGTGREVARLADAVESLELLLAGRLPVSIDAASDAAEGGLENGGSGATLEGMIGRGSGGVGGRAVRDPEMTRLVGSPTRTEVVDAFIQGLPDARSTEQALFLSSYREILERFGFPTSVGTGDAGVRFTYAYTAVDGRSRNLTLWFQDGVVVGLYR